jgi:hypothetical protein
MVSATLEIRETGPRELAGFAPLGGGQPNLQVILLGIGGVDILRPRRYDLDVVVRCGLRSVRSLLVVYWYMFRYFEIVT